MPIWSGKGSRSIKTVQKEPERLWMKGFVVFCTLQTSFKSAVKGWGSDRWWDRRWRQWWSDACIMKRTSRRVNGMRTGLTERRRELIPQVSWWLHLLSDFSRASRQADNWSLSSGSTVCWRMLLSNRGTFVHSCIGAMSRSVSNSRWHRRSCSHHCIQWQSVYK